MAGRRSRQCLRTRTARASSMQSRATCRARYSRVSGSLKARPAEVTRPELFFPHAGDTFTRSPHRPAPPAAARCPQVLGEGKAAHTRGGRRDQRGRITGPRNHRIEGANADGQLKPCGRRSFVLMRTRRARAAWEAPTRTCRPARSKYSQTCSAGELERLWTAKSIGAGCASSPHSVD